MLQLEFELRDGNATIYRHTVELLALPEAGLADAVTTAGLDLVCISPGTGGFTEILARLPAGKPR